MYIKPTRKTRKVQEANKHFILTFTLTLFPRTSINKNLSDFPLSESLFEVHVQLIPGLENILGKVSSAAEANVIRLTYLCSLRNMNYLFVSKKSHPFPISVRAEALQNKRDRQCNNQKITCKIWSPCLNLPSRSATL